MAGFHIVMRMVTKDQVIEMLETINDPELGVDIWTMGLIYDIDIRSDQEIFIRMTFTSPFCPAGEQIKDEVRDGLKLLQFERVNIDVTFDPPWQPSPALKTALGLGS